MNRAERRAARKAAPAYRRGKTAEETLAAFAKRGISFDDLKKANEEGLQQGIREGGQLAYRSIYGALCTVLHENYGFGKKRLYEVLRQTDQKILESLNHVELIEEAWEKTGLQINFDKPFDRIEEVE